MKMYWLTSSCSAWRMLTRSLRLHASIQGLSGSVDFKPAAFAQEHRKFPHALHIEGGVGCEVQDLFRASSTVAWHDSQGHLRRLQRFRFTNSVMTHARGVVPQRCSVLGSVPTAMWRLLKPRGIVLNPARVAVEKWAFTSVANEDHEEPGMRQREAVSLGPS